MNWFARIILFIFVACIFQSGNSQTSISGIINSYAKITSINDYDLVTVDSISDFKIGDTVLVIQMKGADFFHESGQISAMLGAGRYELIAINNINPVTKQIEFRSNLLNLNSDENDYNASEALQIIKVPSYDNATVSGPLTCKPWNGSSGGVLALIVNDTLTLNDSIYVGGKGFLGAKITHNNGVCPPIKGRFYYTEDDIDSAGLKGEGIVSNTFMYKRGRGAAANAGGGGNGKYAGGGGGGNTGIGGRGGKMSEIGCIDPELSLGGSGGMGGNIPSYYFGSSNNNSYRDRVFMGGGGGSGSAPAPYGVNGGNGGGIVFILARTLKTNGHTINANGEDVNTVATNNAAAGGGGAGGSILLAVDEFAGPVNVSAKGGRGGNTSNYCSGHGGGGGAGFVWFSLPSISFSTLNLSGGFSGVTPSIPTCTIKAYNGTGGDSANRFNPVLNGFLYNLIGKTHKICFGETPQVLKGSFPKGGDGNFKYQWQIRRKTTPWTNISNANSKDYQSPPLYDSTYFRRVVKVWQPLWNDTIIDTSKFIMVYVIPEIKSNEIFQDTAICIGLPRIALKGKNASGGDGTLSYLWESRSEMTSWISAAGTNTNKDYSNTSNTETKYYRRKVFSNICTSISDVDTIIVYPLINNNTIASSRVICYNYFAGQLTGSNPGGGSSLYNYKWEKSPNDSSSWTLAGGTSMNFDPGRLTAKTYFRRIALSGLNNTCKDTSTWVRIDITPRITNNSIVSDQTICEAAIPAKFIGTPPSYGNGQYKFQWEKSLDRNTWDSVTTSYLMQDYTSPALFDTTYFRRIVRSGVLDCCKDTSMHIKITVQPGIQNNIVSNNQEICSGQVPAQLKQSSGNVLGGDGISYLFTWEQKTTPDGIWSNAAGTLSLKDYQPSLLLQTTYFRRKVVSGACTHLSDSLKMNVLPLLIQNTISGKNEVCRNILPELLTGSVVSGGTNNINEYRYQWQDSISNGSWNNISINATQINYTPYIIPVKTFFRRIVASGANDCCLSKSLPLELKINELPIGNLVSIDTAICNGTDLNLKVDVSGNPPFNIVIKDDLLNKFSKGSLNSGINSVNIVPLNTSSFQIDSITDSKGCFATSKSGLSKIRLIQVPSANAGVFDNICGLNYTLNATPSVGDGKWSADSEAEFYPSANETNAKVTFAKYGLYSLTWTETNEKCSDSAKIEVTFFEQPVKPDLGRDTVLRYQFNYRLLTNKPSAGNGTWLTSSTSAEILSSQDTSTIIENLTFGKHEVVWQVSNGSCITMSDTLVLEVDDIKRYTGFSPNGDLINDTFKVEGLNNASAGKLVILNRWGSVVYSNNNYKNDWTGTNNSGNPLSDDTYYYILTVDNNRNYKGFIVIKR